MDCFLRPIDYNGFWHVFIARNLSREWLNLQHPPAYLVLLRISDTLSRTVLSYRSWGLLAGVGSVFLLGRLLLELRCRRATAAMGAAVMALSVNSIRLSNEVESYSVCVFLVLASLLFYFRLVEPVGSPGWPRRLAFAALTSLAIAFHYFAGLYAAACVAAPFVLAALAPDYRKAMSKALPKRWLADVATILPPLLVGRYLYQVQAKRWVMPLSSLPSFYYRPLTDTASSFLIRNLRETFNLFAPVAFAHARVAIPILAAVLVAIAWPMVRERREERSPLRLLPLIFLAGLLVGGMVLGLRGLYPFGGQMRHQYLIFLFAVLAGMVALDAALRHLSEAGRAAALGGLAVMLAADFLWQLPALLHPAPDRLRPILEARDMDFRRTGRVSVDQFGLVALFTRYYDSGFDFAERVADSPPIDRYEVRSDGARFEVLAFRDWWIFEFWDDRVFDELSRAWSMEKDGCNGLLRVNGTVFDQPVRSRPDDKFRVTLEARLRAAAAAHGMSVKSLTASEFLDVFAVLCR